MLTINSNKFISNHVTIKRGSLGSSFAFVYWLNKIFLVLFLGYELFSKIKSTEAHRHTN